MGLSVSKCEVLFDDEYGIIYNIITCKYNKIRERFTNKSKLPTTRGGAPYVDRKIMCIQFLAWWDTDLTIRGENIDLSDLNVTMMVYCIDEAKLDYKDGNKDPDI